MPCSTSGRMKRNSQREQQRCDVLTVDVGVGHEHDLVIAQLGDVELVVDARAERGDDRLDFGVLEDAIDTRLLDVDDLSAKREDRLVHRVSAGLGRAACGVALHDVDLDFSGSLERQSASLPGRPPRSVALLRRTSSRALRAATRACADETALFTMVFASAGFASNQCARCSLHAFCTKDLTSVLPSLVLV